MTVTDRNILLVDGNAQQRNLTAQYLHERRGRTFQLIDHTKSE